MTKIVEKDLPEDIKLLESLMMADLALTKSVITGAGVDLLYMLECFTYTFDHPFLDFITHYIMGVSNHSNRMGNDTMGSCRELVVEYIEKTGALDIDRAHDKNHISELVSELKNSIYSEIAALSDYFSEGFTLPEASKIFEKSTTAEIKKIFSKGKSNISLKKRLELSADLNVGIFFEKYLTNKDKTIFHNIYTIFSFGSNFPLFP